MPWFACQGEGKRPSGPPLSFHPLAFFSCQGGVYYDCALLNWYGHAGASACAWHADPEAGSRWAEHSTIVSLGETRRFAFRPKIDKKQAAAKPKAASAGGTPPLHYQFHLMDGDCVVSTRDYVHNMVWTHYQFHLMDGDCVVSIRNYVLMVRTHYQFHLMDGDCVVSFTCLPAQL